jgi:predicted alpha/beta-hydrolase family hydrolase
MNYPKTIESLQPNSTECYLLLPGSSGGIHHPLMKMLYAACTDKSLSTVLLEHPYQTRGAEPPAHDIYEEIDAIQAVYTELLEKGYQTIHVIAKSIGGRIITWMMRDSAIEQATGDIIILGCVMNRRDGGKGVDILAAKDHITLVVQGELDDFGDSAAVKRFLENADCDARVVGIPHADHSYRHNGDKSLPTHELEAVEAVMNFMEQAS